MPRPTCHSTPAISTITSTSIPYAASFENLAALSPHDLRNVLQCVDLRTLAIALGDATDPIARAVIDALFANRESLAELLTISEALGVVPATAVARAKRQVVSIAAHVLGPGH